MKANDSVKGIINFRTDDATVDRYEVANQGDQQPNLRDVAPREIEIQPLTPDSPDHTLDGAGFELVSNETSVKDFTSPEELQRYYAETAELVRERTGARKVVVFDHNLRAAAQNEQEAQGRRGPVRFAHNDYTEKSGPQRVQDLLGDEAEEALAGRYAFVNVWRPINGPVKDSALALSDARTMGPDDFAPIALVYPDRTGEVYAVRYSDSQQWWYAPEMQTDQALLIKGFDSSEDAAARFTAHTAFDEVGREVAAPTRESIEVRTIVLYDEPAREAVAA